MSLREPELQSRLLFQKPNTIDFKQPSCVLWAFPPLECMFRCYLSCNIILEILYCAPIQAVWPKKVNEFEGLDSWRQVNPRAAILEIISAIWDRIVIFDKWLEYCPLQFLNVFVIFTCKTSEIILNGVQFNYWCASLVSLDGKGRHDALDFGNGCSKPFQHFAFQLV